MAARGARRSTQARAWERARARAWPRVPAWPWPRSWRRASRCASRCASRRPRCCAQVEEHRRVRLRAARAVGQGAEEPELGSIFDGLDETSEPLDFFKTTDAPGSLARASLLTELLRTEAAACVLGCGWRSWLGLCHCSPYYEFNIIVLRSKHNTLLLLRTTSEEKLSKSGPRQAPV